MNQTDKANKAQRDIILLQNILQRKLKGSYGVAKSKVHLDMVILCAEFDLEYHKLSKKPTDDLKQNRWYKEDPNKQLIEWPVKEYLKCLRENIKGHSSLGKDLKARSLRNKVNNALKQMRKILMHVNFETGEYYKSPINSDNDIKWILDQKDPPRGKGGAKGLGEYYYNPSFNIVPYIERHMAIQSGVILIKRAPTSAIDTQLNSKEKKVINYQEKLIAAINDIQENVFTQLAPFLKDLSPSDAHKYLEEHLYSKLRANLNKTQQEIIYDKNLKDKVSLIISLCDSKSRGWLKKCIELLDTIIIEYKDFVSPLAYSELLVFAANFITKYGLTDNYRQYKKLPSSWIKTIGNIYLQAIDLAKGVKSYEAEGKYLLEYATFLYDNRQFQLSGKYYREALKLYENTININNPSRQKAYADAIYSLALYQEELNELNEAKEGYELSLKLRRVLAETQEKYRGDVAKTLNNLGNLYKTLFEYDKAEICLKESYDIYKLLTLRDPSLRLNRVISLRNLALIHNLLEDDNQAISEISASLKTISTMAAKEPDEYNCDLAYLLLDYAVLYSRKNNYFEANTKYNQALVLFRDLSILNPHKHRGRLAWTFNEYVIFHRMENQYTNTAFKYYTKALQIYEEMSQEFSIAYDSSIGRTLNLLGDVYYRLQEYDKSEELQTRAYNIYSRLAKENPSKYNTNTAWTLNLLAIIHFCKGLYEQAITENQMATRIYESIAINNTHIHDNSIEWSQSIFNLLSKRDNTISIAHCSSQALDIYITDLQRRSRRHIL